MDGKVGNNFSNIKTTTKKVVKMVSPVQASSHVDASVNSANAATPLPVVPTIPTTTDAQKDFLAALQALETAINKYDANPNAVTAAAMARAGEAFSTDLAALKASGNGADVQMYNAFEDSVNANPDVAKLFTDCEAGNTTAIQTDLFNLQQSPTGWEDVIDSLQGFFANPYSPN